MISANKSTSSVDELFSNAFAYVRFTTRATAVSAYGQRGGAARRANRQGGAGESTYDVRFINNVRIAQIFYVLGSLFSWDGCGVCPDLSCNSRGNMAYICKFTPALCRKIHPSARYLSLGLGLSLSARGASLTIQGLRHAKL